MTDSRAFYFKFRLETDGRTRSFKEKSTDGHGLENGIPWPSLFMRSVGWGQDSIQCNVPLFFCEISCVEDSEF